MGASGGVDQSVTAQEFAPEALLRAVVEMSDDAIFTCDLDGRVTTWSATAERLFGLSTREVLHGPLDVLFPTHLNGHVQSVLATVLAGDRIRRFRCHRPRRHRATPGPGNAGRSRRPDGRR
jgi:PAS domain S-box-containing protein